MKNFGDASVASRSQSEISANDFKSNLLLGTTTKFDSIFPILDQICLNTKIPNIFYYVMSIYIYYQTFFSSLYPFNKYWVDLNKNTNSKIPEVFNVLGKIACFIDTKNEQNLLIPFMSILIIFIISTILLLLEVFSSSRNQKVKIISYYIARFILDIISPIMLIPISAIIGNSISNLVLKEEQINILYLIFGIILYLGFLLYTYLGFIMLNSSTCLSKTPFSAFSIQATFLLPTICSVFIILQFVFSFFEGWVMVIVQITHMVACCFAFYSMYYLPFHTKEANVAFIGVIVSTCINDIIFTVLYFVTPKENDRFFEIVGLFIPLTFLVISIVSSFVFVHFMMKKTLETLSSEKYDEYDENNNNGNDFKLLQNELSSLMSLHLGFVNCLPFFYKWSFVNMIASKFPTKRVLIAIAQYFSFFPGESRQLSLYLRIISKNRDLNYHQRFLIYQIYRIKMLRQSSFSVDANRRLIEVKNISNQCCNDILSFWGFSNVDVTFLELIARENRKVNMKWDEILRDYPNNQKISEEYCTYLIECEMYMRKALIMKQRSNMIELGKNFTIDVPFIRLASCFPIYLKKKVLDYQGIRRTVNPNQVLMPKVKINQLNNIKEQCTETTSNQSSGNHMSQTALTQILLDQEQEETLGRQLFFQFNLRHEMHRALGDRKSYISTFILIHSIIVFLLGFGLFIGMFIYSYQYIDYRTDSCFYLNLAMKTSFHLDLAILGSTIKYAYFSGRFQSIDFFNSLDTRDEQKNMQLEDIFVIDDDISYNFIHTNVLLSNDYLRELLNSLSDLANLYNENIYQFGAVVMNNENPFISCFNGAPTSYVNSSAKAVASYLFLAVDRTASMETDDATWYRSNELCEIMSNQPNFNLDMLELFYSLMLHEVDQCVSQEKQINIFKFTTMSILFILNLIPFFIFSLLFTRDTNKVINMLMGVAPQFKEEAKKPIRKDNIFELEQMAEKKSKKCHWVFIKICVVILSILSSLIIFLMLLQDSIFNHKIENLAKWDQYSSARILSATESINYMLNAVMLNGSSEFNISSENHIVSREKMIEYTKKSLKQLEQSNEKLLKGTDESEPCFGFNDEIDSLNLYNDCEASSEDSDLHESYRCNSISTNIGLLITMVNSVLDDVETSGGNFDHTMISHSIHLMKSHLLGQLLRSVELFDSINMDLCDTYKKKIIIIIIFGLIVTLLLFAIIFYFYKKSLSIYKVAMTLLQRLPLNTFLSEKKLLNFVLNRKSSQNGTQMSTAQSVLHLIPDAVICTNSAGIIETINPALTQILGYTPDQMLGQHISTIFSNYSSNNSTGRKDENNEGNNERKEGEKNAGDADKMTQQLRLIANGQSPLLFEDHFVCVTDDEKEIPCGVKILGMTHDQTNKSESEIPNDKASGQALNIESFVIILRDETELIKQQKEAEAAKAQSENLLYQILPQDIVVRLNSGEKDISFTVQSASIIFTDVVKFSEYASQLSPQEIMGSLSTLFAAFDSCAKNYKMITKIKLIGDIYMAAAGLFSDESSPPNQHALQIINFGLDCLNELEDVNIKLGANLQLRVGVNSGGPILAGVLGTDKPVFDIIGDPINVAARLQTTDVPGRIQIPKETYDLVSDAEFMIEERGEVFLKGKGKTISYLVSPNNK